MRPQEVVVIKKDEDLAARESECIVRGCGDAAILRPIHHTNPLVTLLELPKHALHVRLRRRIVCDAKLPPVVELLPY